MLCILLNLILLVEMYNIICWLYRYCPEEQVLFTRQRLTSRRIQGPSISTDEIPIIVTQNLKLMSSRQRLEQEEEEMFTLW